MKLLLFLSVLLFLSSCGNSSNSKSAANVESKNIEREQIKVLTEQLSLDTTKFFNGNKSAGTRARKSAQELKALLQKLRGEILDNKKQQDND